eukprot:CAMPEP_0206248448 /NCGR_PEP_ID=MMETSP0047_2-20121206/20377_1 /ASSEMBLY_ACC=CAM_ASM_000192 /TAXON_ID=195065 /ORGANISM="Chroomonas mesostigmatica_cf, Strain CCMP1168" /LENGTH=153 /DNA_ID=CAMNT_0053674097 /DNA_START=33 /DNA_END=491 /DNA_ORIENTATION=+
MSAHPQQPQPTKEQLMLRQQQQAQLAQQQQAASLARSQQQAAAEQAASGASQGVLAKRKIAELVEQVSPGDKVDPEVEEVLLEIAEDFVENVTNFACLLAKHRNSSTLEVQDLRLHLEKNWGIKVPGYSAAAERVTAQKGQAGDTAAKKAAGR